MREFTYEDAMTLINKMRVRLGKKFSDQWAGVTPRELATAMVEDYQGLTQEDFNRGIEKLKKAIFAPTVSEFKEWCEPKADVWLDAHEAWAIAKDSVEFGTGRELTVIWTEQAAKAFEKCADLVATGDKFQLAEAKKIFVSIYDRLVTEAKDQGLKPIYVTSLGTDKDQAIAAIKQAEVAGFLAAPEAHALLEHKQTEQQQEAEAKNFQEIAREALAKLAPHIKRNVNKMTEDVKETQPWESMEMQHIDPFDDFEAYKAALQAEQKKLPQAVRFLDEKVGGGV